MKRALLFLLAACGHRSERPRDAAPAPPDARAPSMVRAGFCAPVQPEPIGGAPSRPITAQWNGQRIALTYDPAAGGYACAVIAYPGATTHDMFPISFDSVTGPGPDLHAFVPGTGPQLFVTFTVMDDVYDREMAALAENIRPLTGARRKAACDAALARTPPGIAALTKRATEMLQHFLDTGDPPEQLLDAGAGNLLPMHLDAIRALCQ